jgi:hypothetical protein
MWFTCGMTDRPVLHRTRFWRGAKGASDYTVDLDVEWTVQHRQGVWTAMPTLVQVGIEWPVDGRCIVATSRKEMVAKLAEVQT